MGGAIRRRILALGGALSTIDELRIVQGLRPAYAALAARGTIECVIGLGRNDGADDAEHEAAEPASNALSTSGRTAGLVQALRARGYVEGVVAALPLLAEIGRECRADSCTTYLSRADALPRNVERNAPAKRGIVVRIVGNVDGQSGANAAARFRDGLCHAAICMYAGHWRYGLGPDFDSALGIESCDTLHLPSDATRLARAAAREAQRTGETIEHVLDGWLARGRIRFTRTNAGRVPFGRENLARRDPAARLVHWIAWRGYAFTPVIPEAAAARNAYGTPAYSVWILLSCRSAQSFAAIRSSLSRTQLGLVGMPGTIAAKEWQVLPWILDAFQARSDWSEIVGVVDPHGYEHGLVVDA